MIHKVQKKIMLITNENCNLNCTYCYEIHKADRVMSLETAKRVLDSELADIDDDTIVEIELIGGEAFLAFSLIKNIVDYVDRRYRNKRIHYSCTTNGTLVHGEVQKWLSAHRTKFFCSLSLDGTPWMHNRNRPFKESGQGSFDSIDIDFFTKTWDPVNAKMTVSPETLKDMADGVKYVESRGLKAVTTFATGIRWTRPESVSELIVQLRKLIEYYQDHSGLELCKLLSIDLDSIFVSPQKEFRYCGAGKSVHAYDAAGKRYPCQGFAPVTLGEEAENYIGCDFSGFSLPEDTPCAECRFLYICPTCYACNLSATGDIGRQTPEMCVFNRLCALASAKIQYDRVMRKKTDRLSVEDQKTLKAISIIEDEIFSPHHKFLYELPLK